MAGAHDIPVSVTYTGKTMMRHEVVGYLKDLCLYKIAQDELKQAIQATAQQIQELEKKYNRSPMLPPNSDPPKKDYLGLVFWVIVFLLIGRWLLLKPFGLVIKLIGVAIILFLIYCSISSTNDSYKKACEAWEQYKERYAQEQEWRKQVEADLVDGKPREIAEALKQKHSYECSLERTNLRCQELENEDILPPSLRIWPIPAVLRAYFTNGRVNTLSDAINLYHSELQSQAQRQQMMQMQEDMRMHQQALMMQQNLNAARLSAQINDAKNEIEMDNFIQSCFIQDRLGNIYNELLDQR